MLVRTPMNQRRSLIFVSLVAAATAMAGVDPALLNLAMPDAKILSGIQVDQSAASPFGQYVLSQMQLDAGFLKFVTTTGFDPRRDLREILAAAATANGGTVTQYRGFNLLSSAEQGSNSAVAFLDTTTAAMGDADTVKAAIDRRIAGSNFSGPLAQKANEVSAVNQAWFATVTPLSEFLSGKVDNPNLNGITQS